MAELRVINHPLIQSRLAIIRDKNTDSGMFRGLLREVSEFLGYEATKNIPMFAQEVETPLNVKAKCSIIKGDDIAFVSIMRAGSGMLDGMLKLIPSAKIGHIGLYRDPKIFAIIEYYFKMPLNLDTKQVIIVDPILATGHSASVAVARVKELSPISIVFICLIASPEGVEYFHANHPDVILYAAAIDENLDSRNYIVPGLGDAGDRMFGTS